MERKVIASMLTGYLISMLPVWEIGSRMQAITLTFGISMCVFMFLLWIEGIFENVKKDSHVRQRESQKEKTTFVNSIRNLKRNVKEDYMLKSDFNGYEEFMKKIGEATKEAGSGELLKLVFERQTMWLNKIADAIFPAPDGDMPFIINALEIIAKDMRKDNPEAELVVAHFREAMEFEAHHIDAPGNMTEAAAKTYCEVKKKQHGIM